MSPKNLFNWKLKKIIVFREKANSTFRRKTISLFRFFWDNCLEECISRHYLPLLGHKLDYAGSIRGKLSYHHVMLIIHEAVIGLCIFMDMHQRLFVQWISTVFNDALHVFKFFFINVVALFVLLAYYFSLLSWSAVILYLLYLYSWWHTLHSWNKIAGIPTVLSYSRESGLLCSIVF